MTIRPDQMTAVVQPVNPEPADPPPFDLLGPLPSRTTVLEASAGTGKTYTIAALVTRFVAEGVADLGQLLVVTFTRAATRELQERVRQRLTEARDALAPGARPFAGPPSAGADELLRFLTAGTPDELAARHARLAAATASFDAATVATIHEFCNRVLTGLGTAADLDPGATLVEDLDDLLVEAATDLYVRRYAPAGEDAPAFSPADALALARAAVGDPAARLAPVPEGDGRPAVRARFAGAVRQEVAARRRDRRVLAFDDLLHHLHATLADPVRGPAARERLRGEYRVVLVDEFQDTDPVQWAILRDAFAGHATLVLIGDPKQAIYAFRGGDVHAYLSAADEAGTRATLPRNWRSDEVLLRGLDALFSGAALGDPRIAVTPVTAGDPTPCLRRPGGETPVRIRVVPSAGLPVASRTGLPVVSGTRGPRSRVAADLAAEIVAMLTDGSRITPVGESEERRVHPGDMAVLVRTNTQAELVRDTLGAAGVPCVLRATASVFATPAAIDWLVLLEGIEQPHRTARVRRLAVSGFVGQDAAALVAAGAEGDDRLALRLRAWAAVLAERGVAALFAAVDADSGTVARLLAQPGGERRTTDLRHIGDVLHAAAVEESLGLAALLTWLRRRVTEGAAGRDTGAERSRRLDSDAEAVQIVTIHASKGLEFPVVFVPFAWDRHVWDPETPLFHDGTGQRVRDVGGPGSPGWAAGLTAHHTEESGEDLRLLYVAATRARSSLTLWWARSTTTGTSPLHRLLFGVGPAGARGPVVPPRDVAVPGDTAAVTALGDRVAASAGGLGVDVVSRRGPARWVPPPHAVLDPVAAEFDRALDLAWRRTSYSGLTAAAHEAAYAAGHGPAVGSEPEEPGTTDEPDASSGSFPAGAPGDEALLAVPSPFAGPAGGAAFGTAVHAVLESVDFAAPGLRADLAAAAGVALTRAAVTGVDAEVLAGALHTAVATPLGPLAGGRALTGFGAPDRLVELDFELPLAGGDSPGADVRLGDLAPLLAAHLPAGDPVRPYAERLAGPELGGAALRGYLTGSIDAVLRLRGGAGATRYLVVDYKTNRLSPPDAEPTAWHYRPDALGPAMLASDYPLQALLYTVALHRFLTWRQPGYDPEAHLGGVLYLFLRGMCGPTAPTAPGGGVPGVFAWRPPTALVLATSDLLAGRAP